MSNNYIRYKPQKLNLQDIFDELTLLHPIGPDDPWTAEIKRDFELLIMTHYYNGNLDFYVKSIPFHGLFYFEYNLRKVGANFEELLAKSKALTWGHINMVLKYALGETSAASVPSFDPLVDDPYTFVKQHIFPVLKNPDTNKKLGFRKKAKMIYQILGEYKRQSLPMDDQYLTLDQMTSLRSRITEMVLERESTDTLNTLPVEQIYNRILPSLSFMEQLYAQNFISYLAQQGNTLKHSIKGFEKLYFCHPQELTFTTLRQEVTLPQVPLSETQLQSHAYLYGYLLRYFNDTISTRGNHISMHGVPLNQHGARNKHQVEFFFRQHLFGGCMTQPMFNAVVDYHAIHQIEIDSVLDSQYELMKTLFEPITNISYTTGVNGIANAQNLTTIMNMLQNKSQEMETINEIDLFVN